MKPYPEKFVVGRVDSTWVSCTPEVSSTVGSTRTGNTRSFAVSQDLSIRTFSTGSAAGPVRSIVTSSDITPAASTMNPAGTAATTSPASSRKWTPSPASTADRPSTSRSKKNTAGAFASVRTMSSFTPVGVAVTSTPAPGTTSG